MWKLKGCPKCEGDLFLEKDHAGWYEKCLQCGYNRDMQVMVEVKEQAPAPKNGAPLRGENGRTAMRARVAAR